MAKVDRRTKISAAQWKRKNLPQALAHRCAYLNGSLSVLVTSKSEMLPISATDTQEF